MTTLSGIKDAQYLAQFLGKRIAIRQGDTVSIYPTLHAIFANHGVWVLDSKHVQHTFEWSDCENPYVILAEPGIKVEMK